MSPKRAINLLRGWPSPTLIPTASFRQAANSLFSNSAASVPALQYGPDAGYQPLRNELSEWLGRFYDVSPDSSRICITGGASQSVANILQSYTDPHITRAVWIAAPCYFLVCPIFADSGFGRRLRAVPEDDEGINLEYLERGIEATERAAGLPCLEPLKRPAHRKIFKHIIYVVPTCGNPSGKSMSLSRRQGLVKLARLHDALLISDDVYDFLQWPASGRGWAPTNPDRPPCMRLPRLCDIDRSLGEADGDAQHFGHAVSNGSFSKLVGPGVRTGWVDSTPAFAHGLSQTGSTKSGGAPSQMSAAIIYEMLRQGDLQRHIEMAIRPALQQRHRLMEEAIRSHLLPLGVTIPTENDKGSGVYGGYFIWISLPNGVEAKTVAAVAGEQENLTVGPGSIFEVYGDEDAARFQDKIRLCFSWESEDAIVKGVRRLAQIIAHLQGDKSYTQ